MNKTLFLGLLFAVSFQATPLLAADGAVETVSQMAQDSSVSMDKLCAAVYKAAKENPEDAGAILAEVLRNRAGSTSSDELYKVLQAVMAAVPEVAQNFQRELHNYLNSDVRPTYSSNAVGDITYRVVEVIFSYQPFANVVLQQAQNPIVTTPGNVPGPEDVSNAK